MRTITTRTYTLHGGICGDMRAGPKGWITYSAPLARAALVNVDRETFSWDGEEVA